MPIPIRFIESPYIHGLDPESKWYDGAVDFSKLAVGDMCYYYYKGVPCKDQEHLKKMHLTQHYYQFNSGRPPLILALPNRSSLSPLYFLVDGQCYSNRCVRCGKRASRRDNGCNGQTCVAKGYYDGWTVSGVPSHITVSPSVNFDEEDGAKHYHGFIQNGIIGDG